MDDDNVGRHYIFELFLAFVRDKYSDNSSLCQMHFVYTKDDKC